MRFLIYTTMSMAILLANTARGKVIDLGIGNGHMCALFDSGKAKCWGYNGSGQLGVGSGQDSWGSEPGDMDSLPYVMLGKDDFIDQISVGASTTCVLLRSNQVKCWGDNQYNSLGIPSITGTIGRRRGDMGDALKAVPLNNGDDKVRRIYAFQSLQCATFMSGKMKCWGYNSSGRLGVESTEGFPFNTPEKMATLPYINLGSGFNVATVSAGTYYQICAVSDLGSVKCWGEAGLGLLGSESAISKGSLNGDMGDALSPVKLGYNLKAKKVQAVTYATCVLLTNGKIKCWGYNPLAALIGVKDGVFGSTRGTMGDNLPYVNLGEDYTARDLVCSEKGYVNSCCALMDNDEVKCWGQNYSGILGLGDSLPRGLNPEEIGENLRAVDLGSDHAPVAKLTINGYNACALFTDGRFKCWGSRYNGILGDDGQYDTSNPAVGDGPGEMGDSLPYMTIKED